MRENEGNLLKGAAGDLEHVVAEVDEIEKADSGLEMPLGVRLLRIAPLVPGVYQVAVLKSSI